MCAKSIIGLFPPTQRGPSLNLQFEHYQLSRYEKKIDNLFVRSIICCQTIAHQKFSHLKNSQKAANRTFHNLK